MALLASAGVDWIQIREKDISGTQLAALARQALQLAAAPAAARPAVRILLNDRLDVALAERAGGVHLGENSLPVQEVRRLLRDFPAGQTNADFLVGVSCHSVQAARAAARDGADYIFFGPVFVTPSKTSYGPAQGLDRLAEVCRAIPIPVLAIGGITVQNAASCLAVGAAGIAAIRLFQEAAAPQEMIETLRRLKF